MRLDLPLPADWKRVVQAQQTIYLAPGEPPPAAIAAGVMVAQVHDEDARKRAVLGVELGGRELRPAPQVVAHTTSGWPIELSPAEVVDGERIVERRLLALYRFAEWRALVLVRGFSDESWPVLSPIIRAAIGGARPDWRADGEVYCIAHLFE